MQDATTEATAAPKVGAPERKPWPANWPDEWDGDDAHLWNREETARALGVSLPTFDRMRRDGLPFRREGRNGRPYGYYLPEVWRWREGVEAAAEDERRRKEAQVSQAQLALVGGEAAGDYSLKPKERKELYDAELRRLQLDRQRRDLIEVDEMRAVLQATFGTLKQFLEALPENMARDLGWSLTETAVAQEKCDAFQESLARLLMDDGGRRHGQRH